MLPRSNTRIRSRLRTVDSRCAITIEVRPFISRSIACWISASDSESRLEVASSRIRTGASARKARASATRQLDAALAHQRAVALGQAQDELMRIGQPRRLFDRGQTRAGPGVGDVLGKRARRS